MIHTPVVFSCNGEKLVGIVTAPPADADTALLIIVGGPQYRVGSHRQFYQLAQHAAARGFATMRFDVRGMGDAEGAQRSFEEIEDDIAAAIGALQRTLPSVKRVGLWGLCGGASAALLYCRSRRDPRVAGLALINPWVRSEATQARTRVKHYYLQRFVQKEFWKKLLSGGVGIRSLVDLGTSLKAAAASVLPKTSVAPVAALSLEQRMGQGWQSFAGPILLVLSGMDYTAKEFLETVQMDRQWQTNLAMSNVTRVDVEDADHTFSLPGTQAIAEGATLDWLRRQAGGGYAGLSAVEEDTPRGICM